MVRISDARMSGTAYGTVILHVAPEAAAGGPLAFIRTGDIVTVDVENRILSFDVTDEELQSRSQTPASEAAYAAPVRGWAKLYVDHVMQADTGRRPRLPGRVRAATRSAVSPTDTPKEPLMRRAIITGGQSGLGAACADRLRADGIDVITFDVSPDADYRVDVTDAASIAAAVAAVGPVDILINSAGIVGPNTPLVETDPAAWERTFDVNVHGTFRVIQAVVPGMVERGWGRIVNIASMAGKDGNPNLSAYSASKAAVIGLTKSLGKELAKTGVLVNVDRARRDRHAR